MDRREALRTGGLAIGASLSASALVAALEGCGTEPAGTAAATQPEWTPEFFEEDQIGLIAELAETIFPKTDTPGAKDVKVHQYIDEEVKYMYEPHEQYRFLMGLRDVQARAQQAFGKTFQECSGEQRTQLLQQFEQESQNSAPQDSPSFIAMLKDMTFNGYFTSQEVGEEVLQYDPIPGEYLGCMDIKPSDRIWSL